MKAGPRCADGHIMTAPAMSPMEWKARRDEAVAALVRSRILRTHNPECPCPMPLLYVVQCLIATHYNPVGQPVVLPGSLAYAMHAIEAAPIRDTATGLLATVRYHLLERTAA